MKTYFFLIIVLIFTARLFPQDDSAKVKELSKIYESLEYNTIAFNDLKRKWVIGDPLFIREIYNRFVVKNTLRINNKPLTREELKIKTKEFYEGKVLIDLRKRYYDNEVEVFGFINESQLEEEDPVYLFDPVIDGYYLQEILGSKLYEKVKGDSYFLSDITKTEFDTKSGYFFDINLNLLEPELMFWNTTSNYRNKFLLSLVGKWGNDKIFLPGWFSFEYMGGLRLRYYNNISNDLNDYTYSVTIGSTFPSNSPFVADLPQKRLFQSGQNVYFKISGDPLKFLTDAVKDFQISLEGKYTFSTYKRSEFGLKDSLDFYSNRTYFNLEIKKRNIFNMFDFGMFEAGISLGMPDINHYALSPRNTKIIDLEEGKKSEFDRFSHFINLDLGVVRTGGLIQHHINTLIGYNTDDKYGYYGIAAKVMLSETIGFDFRFYSLFGTDKNKLQSWRTDSYMVFSPIIRINY